MIRQHKKMILLTSIATLLPILIGLLLWKQLRVSHAPVRWKMHGDRRAPSDRHHAVPEYLGAYGARHPPVHFSGDLLLHVLPQGAVTVILFIVSDTNGSNTF